MRVELPFPNSKLFPNAKNKVGWYVWRPQANKERELGRILTSAAIPVAKRKEIALEPQIRLKLTFTPPDRRKRDDDGMISAFKHLRDGIADALKVDDACFRCEYHFAEPKKPGRVLVELVQ